MNNKDNSEGGFTLVEMLGIIAILGVLLVIAVLTFGGQIDKAEKEVCDLSVAMLEKSYEGYLSVESLEHNNSLFIQFVNEYGEVVCPEDGVFSYGDEKVSCSLHSDSESVDDDSEVPFL